MPKECSDCEIQVRSNCPEFDLEDFTGPLCPSCRKNILTCKNCDKQFRTEEAFDEHQYCYYHGPHVAAGEGETMPRNSIGG